MDSTAIAGRCSSTEAAGGVKDSQRIGLAFSGGGSRAIAFHLGCMKALHECKLLADVDVISSVSGGSVLAALYCSREEDFATFEARAETLLRQGLMGRIYASMFSWEGVSALLSSTVAFPLAVLTGLLRSLAVAAAPDWAKRARAGRLFRGAVRRRRTRTDVFERALRSRGVFGRMLMRELPPGRPHLVINAADLRTQTAFRFTRTRAGSWRSGAVVGYEFRLSEAVAASAAFPRGDQLARVHGVWASSASVSTAPPASRTLTVATESLTEAHREYRRALCW